MWIKYFTTPSSSPAGDDVNFSTRLLQQIGKNVVYQSRDDISRTVTVQNEVQSEGMPKLCDSAGRPIETNGDPLLKPRAGTVIIPFSITFGSRSFEDSAECIKENLEAQDLLIVSVAYYTIPLEIVVQEQLGSRESVSTRGTSLTTSL